MSIESALVSLILSSTDITNMIGSNVSPIIRVNDDTGIVYQKISEQKTFTLSGNPSTITYNFQVDVYAKTFSECAEIANFLNNLLSFYQGSPDNQIYIQRIFVINVSDSGIDDDTNSYRKIIEIEINI